MSRLTVRGPEKRCQVPFQTLTCDFGVRQDPPSHLSVCSLGLHLLLSLCLEFRLPGLSEGGEIR